MERDGKTSIIQGVVTGVILGLMVIMFLYVYGNKVIAAQNEVNKIISDHTKQEDLRFGQIVNRLDQGVNERSEIMNNQKLILASQETLTARIIEMRTKSNDYKREEDMQKLANVLIEHSLDSGKKK